MIIISLRIGTSQKGLNISNQFTPGVGSYNCNINNKSSVPKYSFPKHKRDINKSSSDASAFNISSVSPGPGKYDVEQNIKYIKVQAPSYSIKGKHYVKNKEILPGPGQYNYKDCFNESNLGRLHSQGSISRSKRDTNFSKFQDTPGPGSYNENNYIRAFKPNSTMYSFGHLKKENSFVNKSDTPGPGTYNKAFFFGKGKGYTISRAMDKNNSFVTPSSGNIGPGQYDISGKYSNKPNTSGVRIGHSARKLTDIQTISPGPAQYSVNDVYEKEKFKNGFTFTKSKANLSGFSDSINSLSTTTPGPGKYDIQGVFGKGQGFSFNKCLKREKTSEIPGPGQYDDNVSFIKPNHPKYKIGKSLNTSFIGTNDNPGPGQYKYEESSLKRTNRSHVFSKDRKFKDKSDYTPGPGQYKIPCSFRDVNDYSVIGGSFEMNYKFV